MKMSCTISQNFTLISVLCVLFSINHMKINVYNMIFHPWKTCNNLICNRNAIYEPQWWQFFKIAQFSLKYILGSPVNKRQRRIEDPINNLWWKFLQKQLTFKIRFFNAAQRLASNLIYLSSLDILLLTTKSRCDAGT